MKKLIMVLTLFIVIAMTACGNDDTNDDNTDGKVDGSNTVCELGEVYIGEQCVVPTPQQIDYAVSESLNFELTGYDLEYHYFVIQIVTFVSGDMGTYKLEYYKIGDDNPYYEEGLFTSGMGYTLERDDNPNGANIWELRSTGGGIYLYSVWHWESIDNNVQTVYDNFEPMTFAFISK
ncbi:MAG: hypothetical protein JXR62_00980 [Bacilli bacterium]|nr:hypothetical protein [Bacilli bacterium]